MLEGWGHSRSDFHAESLSTARCHLPTTLWSQRPVTTPDSMSTVQKEVSPAASAASAASNAALAVAMSCQGHTPPTTHTGKH